jgi:hypothetical protein
MDRRGRISLVNVFLLLGLVAAAVLAWTFLPYYWDYMKMQEVTKSAVLEWDAWDERRRAEDKLADLLDRRSIPDYILAEDCQFLEEPDQIYTVRCAWKVDVYYPFTQKFKTLSFETLETVDDQGLIH